MHISGRNCWAVSVNIQNQPFSLWMFQKKEEVKVINSEDLVLVLPPIIEERDTQKRGLSEVL